MDLFTKYNEYLEQENEIREKIKEVVRELDGEVKNAVYSMQGIHHSLQSIGSCCLETRKSFGKFEACYTKLAAIIPPNQYSRFSDHWFMVTQRVINVIALVIYLEAGFLVTYETTAEILGLKTQQNEGFYLELESYLHGILHLSTELSRFAVNAVTMGDYSRVKSLQLFLNDINSGFRLLNLKNDGLRKRFDALKYDVKKIESIIYDLSIRGLIKNEEALPVSPTNP